MNFYSEKLCIVRRETVNESRPLVTGAFINWTLLIVQFSYGLAGGNLYKYFI